VPEQKWPKSNIKFTGCGKALTAKAELSEIVQYLKDPAKLQTAEITRGVPTGPPGTGERRYTKLAGEADVPLGSILRLIVESLVSLGCWCEASARRCLLP
jgi:ATP-dependent Zn protease